MLFLISLVSLLATLKLYYISSQKRYQKIVITIPLFTVISYYGVVYFFGTYIYELPTHKCPFCMMQKEYHYVGYLLWGTLFFGSAFGLIYSIVLVWLKDKYR